MTKATSSYVFDDKICLGYIRPIGYETRASIDKASIDSLEPLSLP